MASLYKKYNSLIRAVFHLKNLSFFLSLILFLFCFSHASANTNSASVDSKKTVIADSSDVNYYTNYVSPSRKISLLESLSPLQPDTYSNLALIISSPHPKDSDSHAYSNGGKIKNYPNSFRRNGNLFRVSFRQCDASGPQNFALKLPVLNLRKTGFTFWSETIHSQNVLKNIYLSRDGP